MKWSRAAHHVDTLARACADLATRPASIFPLRVRQLWAAREIVGPPRPELDVVTVALCVDLPEEDVAWLTEPRGAQHWANATRMAHSPVIGLWRSAHAPVWNHHLDRPVLVWDDSLGVVEEALAALREGRGEGLRAAAPPAAQLRVRLERELAVSLAALRSRTREYDERRWSPGKLEPVADALYQASDGYLDVMAALDRPPVNA